MENPYAGPLGQTQIERAHVPIGGVVRSCEVVRAINLATHPKLSAQAMSAAPQRVTVDGALYELAIAYCLHDPDARRFVLVVPEALRHRALEERAKVLARIAEDVGWVVPRYVLACPVVVGAEELREHLSKPVELAAEATDPRASMPSGELEAREGELKAREATVEQRDAAVRARESDQSRKDAELSEREGRLGTQTEELRRAQMEVDKREGELRQREADLRVREEGLESRDILLKQREERITARAEDVTAREDELREAREEAEARDRDLTLREQELQARVETLAQRERELSTKEAELLVGSIARRDTKEMAAILTRREPTDDDVEEEVDEDELEPERISHVEPLAPAELVEGASTLAEVEELADEDEVAEELDDLDGVEVTGVGPMPASRDDELAAPPTEETVIPGSKTLVDPLAAAPKPRAPIPPASLTGDVQMVATVEGGQTRLFAKLDRGRDEALGGACDLLVQLALVQGCPVILLALVEVGVDRPYARRAALDPRRPEDRRVLDALQRGFRASVSTFTDDTRHKRTFDVEAPREVNVALVLERAAKSTGDASIDTQTAAERALAAPPPVTERNQPFVAEGPAAIDVREAQQALARLTPWTTPDKLDRALLALSIPADVVDATFRRALGDAARFGLALTPALRDRAVSVGVAKDAAELVAAQTAAFAQLTEGQDRGGLGADEVAANWEALLKDAGDLEVAVDAEVHDTAWRAIRTVRGEGGGTGSAPEVDPAKLPEMGPPELVLLLDHPKVRRLAALELCRRGDPALVDTVYKAVRKMPRAEVVRVAPRVVTFGESAGDALIDGLGAKKTFVRQASALALGHLKLRRAVVPMLHLLQSEPSDVWKDVARVLGEMGSASYRTVVRAAKEAKTPDARLAWCLAHLSNHGQRKALRELAQGDEDAHTKELAGRAMVLEDDAKKDGDEARGAVPYAGTDPVKLFARRFYQELDGTAPEGDLEADGDVA